MSKKPLPNDVAVPAKNEEEFVPSEVSMKEVNPSTVENPEHVLTSGCFDSSLRENTGDICKNCGFIRGIHFTNQSECYFFEKIEGEPA